MRSRLYYAGAIVWSVLTMSLAAWWLIFALQEADRLREAGGPNAAEYARVHRMLGGEGATLFALLIAGGAALMIGIRREQQRQRGIAAFFMAFTHDLKTSLASLQLQAESLREDLPEIAGNRNLDRLLKDSVRLQLQLENSLYFAQPDGRLLLEPVSVRPSIERLREDWPEMAIEVRGDASVRADRRAFDIVLRNLLQNAAVHGAAARVSIDLSPASSRRVVIDVADNGRGLAANTRLAVDSPFAATGPSAGTGVGLFVSRQLLRRMGGTLEVVPREAPGFTARLILPDAH